MIGIIKNEIIKMKINKYLIMLNHSQINFNGDEYYNKNGKNVLIEVKKEIIMINNCTISNNGLNWNEDNNKIIGNGGKMQITCPKITLYHSQILSLGGHNYKTNKQIGQNGEIIINGHLNLFDNSTINPKS